MGVKAGCGSEAAEHIEYPLPGFPPQPRLQNIQHMLNSEVYLFAFMFDCSLLIIIITEELDLM